jgi:hypothetical protein
MNTSDQLVEELHNHGFLISEISDLYNKKYNYREIIPVLIKALDRENDPVTLEQIVRALTVPWARPAAAKSLAKLFSRIDGGSELGLRWVVGNALSVVADDSVYDEIVSYISNAGFGRSREMLVLALAKMRTRNADEILMRLLNDKDLVGHALIAVRKRKFKGAMDIARSFENDPHEWIRKEAKKTVDVLERIE